jgi:hypothetical protein
MRPPAEPGLPAWLVRELHSVPGIPAFAGVDELAAESARLTGRYPDVISSRTVGHSADGEPLTCLTIDGGPSAPHALVYGLPHPNEPAGGLTSLHLTERLASDPALRRRLGLTWHIVPTIDPDGLRMNEGWLRGPFTQPHYTRNFYRQASARQIDWNFPVDGAPAGAEPDRPPETLALMRLIDEHRPALLAALHNAEIGDVFYYLGRDEPALIDTLQRIPGALGMSLYRGIPESGWVHHLAAGVHHSLDILDSVAYDRDAGRVADEPTGNSSSTYAARHGALALITEVPYWRDPRTSDSSPGPIPVAESLTHRSKRLGELGAVLDAALGTIEKLGLPETPLLEAARHFSRTAAADAADALRRAALLPPGRTATVAELASNENSVHLIRLRTTGLLLRVLDPEMVADDPHPAIRSAHAELTDLRASWSAEVMRNAAAGGVTRNPIEAMVAAQYGSVLATADHLARSR